MVNNAKYLFFGIALAFLFRLFLSEKGYFEKEIIITTTDTIYVDRPYKIEVIKEVEVPVKVVVYQRDTIYREKLEQDTLITFLSISPKLAEIHTLTPTGKPSVAHYPIEDFTHLDINHKGKLKTKKKKQFWRNLERMGIFVGGVWVGSKINASSHQSAP